MGRDEYVNTPLLHLFGAIETHPVIVTIVALGAVTGILSGGVTLIGGALAGAAGGAVLGALFHKNIGLTDTRC